MKYTLLLLAGLFFFSACSTEKQVEETAKKQKAVSEMSDEELTAFADSLAHTFIIADSHVDLPYRLTTRFFKLYREYIGIPIESEEGDFDYVRAKKGGLDAPFMSIYIPADYQKTGGGKQYADSLINMIEVIAKEHTDKFALAGSPAEVRANFEKGLISLPMGMENGAPIETVEDVAYFQQKGIRYVTLTHSKDNKICDSSYDTTGTNGGLSAFGKEVVKEMNKQGIMVDISHVSDEAFYQVMEVTQVPAIASHSSCRKYTPGWERNMDDDMIKKLGENGGVIQINFGSTFLDSNIKKQRDSLRGVRDAMLAEAGTTLEDSLGKAMVAEFNATNKDMLYADLDIVANHIDHVVELIGVDHVGFGSDFDGVGDSLPNGLKDVSMYPNLIKKLLERGYTPEDIEKICFGNIARVWSQVEAFAAK
ncbi:MAG: dipeptidase [Saprospiraceae bacterium]|nr:dipeptidase [Saprospiraceae bacterium]